MKREVRLKSLLSAASFFLLVLLGGVTLSAATEGTPLQAQDNGQEIRVPAGAIIELSLPEQAGTGYRWEFRPAGCAALRGAADRNQTSGYQEPGWRSGSQDLAAKNQKRGRVRTYPELPAPLGRQRPGREAFYGENPPSLSPIRRTGPDSHTLKPR